MNTHRAIIDACESRRLMSVGWTATSDFGGGTYGADDLFEVNVTIKNTGSKQELPVPYEVIMSSDKILGNADDVAVPLSAEVILPMNAGETRTVDAQFSIGDEHPGGVYNLAIVVDPWGSVGPNPGKPTSVSWASNKIEIVTNELPDGPVAINGTSGKDDIRIRQTWANTIITVNGVSSIKRTNELPISDAIFINGGSGNDRIVAEDNVSSRLAITGAGGNDYIVGGKDRDELSGANGHDTVIGGEGNDYILGGAQNDSLNGGKGDDTMSGGGGHDKLTDSAGHDHFLGGAGNDVFNSKDASNVFSNQFDTLSGGSGDDKATRDSDDYLASIESLIG